MASSVANTLKAHYSNLGDSTQRLSSGLRVNSAADDAAGLAIRELQRADIAALAQGARNANDAISMLQVFDGALTVIDEKLIRMKELAEQAATGTYDSTQRLMIDSEFQAMGSEIDHIARATDFNGIKLLDGIYSPTKVIQVQVGTKKEHTATANKLSINSPATSAKDISAVSISSYNLYVPNYSKFLPTTPDGAVTNTQTITLTAQVNTEKTLIEGKGQTNFDYEIEILGNLNPDDDFTFIYEGNEWKVTAPNADGTVSELGAAAANNVDGTISITTRHFGGLAALFISNLSYYNKDTKLMEPVTNLQDLYDYDNTIKLEICRNGVTYKRTKELDPPEITMKSSMGTAKYESSNNKIEVDLGNGDAVWLDYTPNNTGATNPKKYIASGEKITFNLGIGGTATTKTTPIYENRVVPVDNEDGIPDTLVRIHFGTGFDQKEDYYDVTKYAATREALGLKDVDVQTQENAQKTLVKMNDAIVAKDKIRANYGALQNRLENTVTNNLTQMEMLQASESRISDADIATEMMEFVRAQVLTNSAVAMLAQANSMPQMIMRLIGA